MTQLIMRWQNDNTPPAAPDLPADVALYALPALPDGINAWLEIVAYMGQEPVQRTPEFYEKVMSRRPNYDPAQCFIFTVEGVPAATVTVICDRQTREGYVHMVACKPTCRGRGLGHLLAALAVQTLRETGMRTAYLTTDDWRIAAIKTYLQAGFTPDLQTHPDHRPRWEAIFGQIGKKP